MQTIADAVLLAIAVLLAKHCIVDFFLQGPYQLRNKGNYAHPGGILHATLHGIGSLPVLAVLPPSTTGLGIAVIAAEILAHYHIDWLRERLNKANGWTPHTVAYWRLMGIDQLAHGLTYVAMARALI